MLEVSQVEGVKGVQGKAIATYGRRVSSLFFSLLGALVMEGAEALKLSQPEQVWVTLVGNDVVDDARWFGPSQGGAHDAEGIGYDVKVPSPSPPSGEVQLAHRFLERGLYLVARPGA